MPSPTIELAILLLFIGLLILAAELFIPSAGILLITALVCIAASVIVAFLSSAWAGLGMLALVVVLAIFLPSIGLKLWQMTPIGRRMFLPQPEPEEESSTASDGFEYASLLGQMGKTLTPLRPAGKTDFSGRRIDTVSEGVMIEQGAWVRVVAVEGTRIVVRRVDSADGDAPRLI